MFGRRLGAVVLGLVLLGSSALAVSDDHSGGQGHGHSDPAALVGTWRVDVGQSTSGLPPFRSLHTYHSDGTFTETTDLLGKLGEGPGHGAWNVRKGIYNLTFELFIFDENKDPAGIIRVRCAVTLVKRNKLAGEATVDYIDPAGNLFTDIDAASFTGRRVRVIPK